MAYILYDEKGKEVLKHHMVDVRMALETGKYFLTNPRVESKPEDPDPAKIEPEDLKEVVAKTPPPPEPPPRVDKKKKHEKPQFPGQVVTNNRLTPAN